MGTHAEGTRGARCAWLGKATLGRLIGPIPHPVPYQMAARMATGRQSDGTGRPCRAGARAADASLRDGAHAAAHRQRARHAHQVGSFYTVVQNLERHGFIKTPSRDREGRRPERTIYSITDAGRAELRDWACESSDLGQLSEASRR